MSFIKDLGNAQQVENELQQMYIASGYTATSTASLGQYSGYDLTISSGNTFYYTIEVKHDIMALKTDNVAIELYKKNKVGDKENSGLSATTADYHVYKIGDLFYILSTPDLKALLRKLKDKKILPIVNGGDNQSVALALVGLTRFKNACTIV